MVDKEFVLPFSAIGQEPTFLSSASAALNILKWGDCEMEEDKLPKVTVLSAIYFGEKAFFADLKLKQFRQVDNVYNFINFNNDDGKAMRRYGNDGLTS